MAKLYFVTVQWAPAKRRTRSWCSTIIRSGTSVLMVKPALENRDGERTLKSCCGLSAECVFMEELDDALVQQHDCVIVDEAQFLTKAQVEYCMDENIPVIAYGLRADFRGEFFEGSQWLMCWADTIEEVKTICWCGKRPSATPASTMARWSKRATRFCWAATTSTSAYAASIDDRRIRRLQRPESVKEHKECGAFLQPRLRTLC